MATKTMADNDSQKENKSLGTEAVKDKYDKIKVMCDDLWSSGVESIVVTADTQAGAVWSCGSTNGVLFLKEYIEMKEKFLMFCVDMTSRPSDDCYKTGEPGDDRVRTCNPSDDCYKTGEPGDDRVRTCNPSDDCYKTGEPGDDRVRTCNPSDELMTNIPDNESEVDDVDDHHDIETDTAIVPKINKSLTSVTSQNKIVHEVSKNKFELEKVSQANRVQTRFSNRRSSNQVEKRTCIQDKLNSNKEIKEKKGKQNKMEAQRKDKSADNIPMLNNKERNAKAPGPSKIVRSQARKRAKLEPKSNEAMHSKENSVEAGIEMQIHASQDVNFEEKVYTEMGNIEERQYTEMKGIKGNGLRTQSTESESMDITVKSNTEGKCGKIEDLEMEFVSDCDFIVTKQDGNDIKDKEAIFKHDRTIHHIQINEDKNQHSNINKTGETPRAFLELKCGICGLEAKNRADFREHLFKVHNNKRVKCDQCERPFRDSYALRRHKIVKHSTDKNVKCDVCNKVFKLHDNMILHRQRFHELRFACEICGTNQPTAYTLKKHVEMVHEKKNLFVCDICGEGFVYAHRFRIHKRRHAGEFPFKCSYCDKRYTSKESRSHHENTHTREREYICDLCGNKYLQYGHLARHKQLHDKTSQPIKCKFCDAGFRAYSAYRSHVFKEHQEEALATGSKMILKCEYCPKLFAHPTHLQAHVNRHTGAKPYKCEICGKSFNDKSNLRQHKYSHDDNEVYHCSYCPKVYTQRRGYRAHLKTHEGIEGVVGGGEKVEKMKKADNLVGVRVKTNKMKGIKGVKRGWEKVDKKNDTTDAGRTGMSVVYNGDDIQNIINGDKAFTVAKDWDQNDRSFYTVLNTESPNQTGLTGNRVSSITECVTQSLKGNYNDMPTLDGLAANTGDKNTVIEKHATVPQSMLDRLVVNSSNENTVAEKHATVPYLNTSSSYNTHVHNQYVGNIPTIVSSFTPGLAPNSSYINTRHSFVETPSQDIVNAPVQGIPETHVQGTANAPLQSIGETSLQGIVKRNLQSAVTTLVNTPLHGSVNTSLPETVDALMHSEVEKPIQGIEKPIQGIEAIPQKVSLDTSIPLDNTEIYIFSLAETANDTQSQDDDRIARDGLDASEYQVQLQGNDIREEQNYVFVPQNDETSTVLVWQDKAM